MNKYVLIIDKDKEYTESVIVGHKEATQQIIKFYYNNCMDICKPTEKTGKLYTEIVAETLGVIIILVSNGSLLAFLPDELSKSQIDRLRKINNNINEINEGKKVFEKYRIEFSYKDKYYRNYNELEKVCNITEKNGLRR